MPNKNIVKSLTKDRGSQYNIYTIPVVSTHRTLAKSSCPRRQAIACLRKHAALGGKLPRLWETFLPSAGRFLKRENGCCPQFEAFSIIHSIYANISLLALVLMHCSI